MPKTKQFDEAEVLQRARELFREKGYNGTSMDELVKVTGLNRSSLYDTFGDKRNLYIRSLEEYQQNTLRLREESLQKITSPRKKIQYMFNQSVKEILSDPRRKGCFMVNATTELANQDKKVSKLAGSNMECMEGLFYQWIKEGQAIGEIANLYNAKALARYLFSSISGLQVIGQTVDDKSVLEDVVKVTLSVLDVE
jgi:TetR/AcrR family transcriptional regulator, transcriptional repressor for nem operon